MKTTRIFACAGVALALALAAGGAEEKAPGVEEIVRKSNQVAYYQGKDGRAVVKMTITDGQGNERTREFVILRRDEPAPEDAKEEGEEYCGDQKFYVYFQRPADINRMAFMVWKHVEGDDDRWLYLPALDSLNRIAAADKRTSFVGSDFFYEDVSGRSLDEDSHELVETSDTYYVLKCTPKDPKSVEFAYYKMWVHTESFLTIEVKYYDKNDTMFRHYKALEVKEIQGHWTVTKAMMKDVERKSQTVLEYSSVEYDLDIPEDIFTERYLRRAPRKYLK